MAQHEWVTVLDMSERLGVDTNHLNVCIFKHKDHAQWTYFKKGVGRRVDINYFIRLYELRRRVYTELIEKYYEAKEILKYDVAIARELHKYYPYHAVNTYNVFLSDNMFSPTKCLDSYTCLQLPIRAVRTLRGLNAILRKHKSN